MRERIAIIDLGTNTFHLLIAEREDANTQILYREKQPVKIGLGGINRGVITEEAVRRAVTCLIHFKNILNAWNVIKVHALGTSAMRNAVNGQSIIQKIKTATGIDVKLISGEEEAEYIYHGIRSALDLGMENSLIVDIGGGSVECIIGNRENIFWKRSFEVGAQRLLELYHRHDPITWEEGKQLEDYLANSLMPLGDAIRKLLPVTLVGSSGTFDTLSEIYCIKENIAILPDQKETPLTLVAFYEIHAQLISMDRAARLKIPGMIEMRVDMIVVASCLVKYLIDNFSFANIRVSSYSLKEGALVRLH